MIQLFEGGKSMPLSFNILIYFIKNTMLLNSFQAYFDNLTKLNPQILGEYMLGIKRQSKEEIRGSIYEE